MRTKQWILFLLLFLVRVKVPFGVDLVYHHVKDYTINYYSTVWTLTLADDRKVMVPVMWTVIEEEIKGDN